MKQLFSIELVSMVNNEFSHGFDLGFVDNEETAKSIVFELKQLESIKDLGYEFNYRVINVDTPAEMHIKVSNEIINEYAESETKEALLPSQDELYSVYIDYKAKGEFSHRIDLGVFGSQFASENKALEELIGKDLFLIKNQDLIVLEKVETRNIDEIKVFVDEIVF